MIEKLAGLAPTVLLLVVFAFSLFKVVGCGFKLIWVIVVLLFLIVLHIGPLNFGRY